LIVRVLEAAADVVREREGDVDTFDSEADDFFDLLESDLLVRRRLPYLVFFVPINSLGVIFT
jgi:hypothetical protein